MKRIGIEVALGLFTKLVFLTMGRTAAKQGRDPIVYWGCGLGIAFNNQGAVGWFPIFANFQFSCLVLWKKADEVMIKLSVCVANVCWAIFNFSLLNYANLAANVVIVTSGIALVVRELISRKKAEKTEDSVQKARAYRK